MNINDYIKKLTNASNEIEKHMREIVLKNEGHLLSTIKLRLYRYGIKGDGTSLGDYSPFTKQRKLNKGQISSHVTLRDSGGWYNSMWIDFKDSAIIIDASDEKTFQLESIYGESILGLTDNEVEDFFDSRVEPELENLIDIDELDLGEL